MRYSDLTSPTLVHQGAHVRVTRARGPEGQPVIVKALPVEAQSAQAMARLQYEWRVLQVLHAAQVPGVPVPIATLDEPGTYALVMSDGGGADVRSQQGALSLRDILHIGAQAARILARLHQARVIHKDINPSNIVYDAHARTVQLIDFDLASQLQREPQSGDPPQSLEGTLAYLSPEQTGRMNRHLDYRTDFFSLGVTLYELLGKRLPFTSAAQDLPGLVHAILTQDPPPLDSLDAGIAPVLGRIVARLMAKVPEERYHSAAGVAHDLSRCLEMLENHGHIEAFALGSADQSEAFEIPQKLYGREHEVASLLAMVERVTSGQHEILLVAGAPGIGKSALVREAQRRLSAHNGLFAAGKYDQLRRNTPFYALSQAIHSIIRRVLMEPEEVLQSWRRRVAHALGNVGQAVVSVVPSVELLVGKQKPISRLGPQEEELRLMAVLHRFLLAISEKQPLVLFLDDLQWADSGTLQLVSRLGTEPYHGAGLLFVGAYRDQEVSPTHPLIQCIKTAQQYGTPVHTLPLLNLGLEAVEALVQDATGAPADEARPLAQLVAAKTGCNAFYVNEFLKVLWQQDLLVRREGRWRWDLARITQATVTANMAELLADALKAMPAEQQEVLASAACLGNEVRLEVLSQLHGLERGPMLARLQPLAQRGFLIPATAAYRYAESTHEPITYRFAHDRIQSAAYALWDEPTRQARRLRMGRVLLGLAAVPMQADALAQIVEHFNAAQDLLDGAAERQQVAELNIRAGMQAAASMAHDAAVEYLQTAWKLMPEDMWSTHSALAHDIVLTLARVESFRGHDVEANRHLDTLVAQAQTPLARARALGVRAMLLSARGRHDESIAATVQAVRPLGLRLTQRPGLLTVGWAYLRLRWAMRGMRIADLAKSPALTDEGVSTALALAHISGLSAAQSDSNYFLLMVLNICRYTARYGMPPQSFAYTGMVVLHAVLGDYAGAEAWGAVVRAAMLRFPHTGQHAITLFGLTNYVEHLQLSSSALLKTMQQQRVASLEEGNQANADNCLIIMRFVQAFSALHAGVQAMAQEQAEMTDTHSGGLGVRCLYQFSQCLRGDTTSPTSFSNALWDEAAAAQGSQSMRAIYHHLKLLAAWVHRDFALARQHAQAAAEQRIFESNTDTTVVFFCFHACLALAQPGGGRGLLFQRALHRLRAVAKTQSPVHGGMLTLVEAEQLARRGQDARALQRYEQATQQLQNSSYPLLAATGFECAGRFCHGRKFHSAAAHHLQRARQAYAAWGALPKVRALDVEFAAYVSAPLAGFAHGSSKHASTAKEAAFNDLLDVDAIAQAARTLSGEVHLDQLLEKLLATMRSAVGATRAALVTVERDGSLRCVGDTAGHQRLPDDVLQFTLRSREALVVGDNANLGDAAGSGPEKQGFDSEYMRTARPRALPSWCRAG